jgi:two-component sensor histidine kinase
MSEFQRVLDLMSQLYQNSPSPVIVTDRNLKIAWANPKSIENYPGFSVPDGLTLMIPSATVSMICALPESSREPVVIPLPVSGIELLMTPVPGGYIVHFDHMNRAGSGLQPEGSELLLSALSNQMRAPLTAIFSALSLIQHNQRFAEDEILPELIGSINKNSYQMLRFMSNITRYIRHSTRTDSFNPVRINFSGFIRRLCEACAVVLSETDIPLSCTVSGPDIYLLADPDKLSVALLQLFSNSCRFTRPGNRIDVAVGREDNRAIVTVSDRGLGIPPDIQSKVFEPFFSYDHFGRPFAGTGLGLSIVRYSVSQHGGAVALSSVEGQQTTVALQFPIRDDPDLEVQSSSTTAHHLRDRFSNMHVILSDCCECPPPS